jgi:hypothetical protein
MANGAASQLLVTDDFLDWHELIHRLLRAKKSKWSKVTANWPKILNVA